MAFVVAIISSLAASFIAYFDPVRRWEALQAASMRLRSEIVQFRTRTLNYEIHQKRLHKAVAEKLMDAVVSLRASTLAGQQSAPQAFSEIKTRIFFATASTKISTANDKDGAFQATRIC